MGPSIKELHPLPHYTNPLPLIADVFYGHWIAPNLAVVHKFKRLKILLCHYGYIKKITPPIKMLSSSNAEETKVYFAIFTSVLFRR